MGDEKKVNTERVTRLRQNVRYTVAGIAILLLIFIFIEGYKFYTLSPEKLYAQCYTPYELTTIRDDNDSASAIEKAYKEKNYSEVIKLNRLSVLSVKDIFLTGMAFLETRDYSRAVRSFQIVITDIKDNRIMLKDVAEYYLSLAYLQDRDYDQAIELMSAIHDNSSHAYSKKFSRKYINRVKRLKWR